MKIFKTYESWEMLRELTKNNKDESRVFQLNYPHGATVKMEDGFLIDLDTEDGNLINLSVVCSVGFKWTEIEPIKKKTKLTQFEYQLLVNRPEGYDWVARDNDGDETIEFYEFKPDKFTNYYSCDTGGSVELHPFKLSFLTFENSPCYIPDLLENCEIDDRKIIIDGKETIRLTCAKNIYSFKSDETYEFKILSDELHYVNESDDLYRLSVGFAEEYFRMK